MQNLKEIHFKSNGIDQDLKSMYVKVNGEPVKVWDKEHGVLDQGLFDKTIKAVMRYG